MSELSFETYRDYIAEHLEIEPEKLTYETRFQEDLELDSLDLVELVSALESEYNLEISDDELMEIKTLGQGYEIIKAKLEANKTTG